MKRTCLIINVLGLVILAGIAQAATNIYSPQNTAITVPAGASRTIPATVGIENAESGKAYFTRFLDAVHGNLPKAWISSSPGITFLSDTSSSQDVMYTITVPEGTPSGTYSGYVLAKATAAHRTVAAGTGLFVQVTVPARCSGVPKLVNVAIRPEMIWPPNRRMDEVTVTGTVEYPDGCKLLNFGYSIEDEYGAFTSTGHAAVGADRTFSFTLPVEAWREGADKDGRHYRITVFGEDEAGIGMSDTHIAVVPHDHREK